MILTKVDYFEHKGQDNYWEIKDVNLDMLNLIIGQNATGKSRLISVITSFAKIISKKIPRLLTGNWNLEFVDRKNKILYQYDLSTFEGIVVLENIRKNGKILLTREKENGEIFSHTGGKLISFHPPENELTSHVRRDTKEYPFLEDFLRWANSFHGYSFTNVRPNQIMIPNRPEILLEEFLLEDLSATPYLLVSALKNRNIIDTIIEDFSTIGYPIKNITVSPKKVAGIQNDLFFAQVWEKDLSCPTDQLSMSQGMYRAFSLLVIIEHLLRLKKECTIVIDDLGEGLDFERSSKTTNLLFKKLQGSPIQLIATSNDRFLINNFNMKSLNLLERTGHVVTSYNYQNNKEKFDEFSYTGLSNFDFFSGKMYKEWSQN